MHEEQHKSNSSVPADPSLTRRDVLKAGLMGSAGILAQQVSAGYVFGGGALDPASLKKYVDRLPLPAAAKEVRKNSDFYEITMTEFMQKLHQQLPPTRVWGYNGTFPGPTIEARAFFPVTVKWTNRLPTAHLLPVDKTLHGAEVEVPEVRTVVHLHGGHSLPGFDGHPDDWWTSVGSNSRVFTYANDQPAATLWYHDHAIGITRLNVYAGLAAFYMLRGSDEQKLNLPRGEFEIPLAIQDRSFNPDGSLFYPNSRAYFDGFTGPYIPESDISPVWNPEFFGDAILVNGKVWPFAEVEQRRYRLRCLNGCNSRFLILGFDNGLEFYQIGSDGGFLPNTAVLQSLLIAPGERADVIVDFSKVKAGAKIHLLNVGPDQPYNGVDDLPADAQTTGQVMQFRIVKSKGKDKTTHPLDLVLPAAPPLGAATLTRRVSLNEVDSAILPDVGPAAALLGSMDGNTPLPLMWDDASTENPSVGTTEIWEVTNFTMDAHPIHLHLVQFEVLGRTDGGGQTFPPEPWEYGRKDTVIAYPGEVTRIKAHFDILGSYVWHCHILEHEDNEMMRPLTVV